MMVIQFSPTNVCYPYSLCTLKYIVILLGLSEGEIKTQIFKHKLAGGEFSDCTEWRVNKLSTVDVKVGLMYRLQCLQMR
jgi:hypothetical protein